MAASALSGYLLIRVDRIERDSTPQVVAKGWAEAQTQLAAGLGDAKRIAAEVREEWRSERKGIQADLEEYDRIVESMTKRNRARGRSAQAGKANAEPPLGSPERRAWLERQARS